MTVSYRCIGKGVTNSNGVAHMTHSYDNGSWVDLQGDDGYTGVGVGELDLVASLDNPSAISTSSIQSEPYTVTDAVIYDTATEQKNTIWRNYGVSASYSDDGTFLEENTDYRYEFRNGVANDTCVEFDMYIPSTSTDDPRLYLRSVILPLGASDFPRDTWHTVKIVFTNLHYDVYKNGTFVYGYNLTAQNTVFQFRVDNAKLKFKNFRFYPI